MIFRHLLNMRSHPTWVRGLKRIRITETRIRTMFYSNSDT